jgi:outer membrane protein TolC
MYTQKKMTAIGFKLSLSIITLTCFCIYANEQPLPAKGSFLSLDMAVKSAQSNDPWLSGNRHKQSALESMSIAVSTLANPKITLRLANLPTNGFDFGQEGMTQAQVGLSQMFPRGDTLAIKRQQLNIQSQAYPYQRQDRKAKIAVDVGSLWLEIYKVQASIALIETNRSLFEQLIDVAEASYASTLGKTRQQDIIRAQLALTRLDDRLDKLAQQKYQFEGMLAQWLTTFSTDNSLTDFSIHNIKLSHQLPEIELFNAAQVVTNKWLTAEKLVPYFSNHASVRALDKKIKASKSSINLAKQQYLSAWGVSASYGYRADDGMGRSRADLFSVGVTVDLPLFTTSRQDNQVKSAISQTEAVKTEKLLLLRQLIGFYTSAKGRLLRLNDRQDLYKLTLLPGIQDQAQASLTAYTHDDGDFANVVRSRIAVLNAEIEQLAIAVEKQKLHLELNYLFAGSRHNATTEKAIAGSNNE